MPTKKNLSWPKKSGTVHCKIDYWPAKKLRVKPKHLFTFSRRPLRCSYLKNCLVWLLLLLPEDLAWLCPLSWPEKKSSQLSSALGVAGRIKEEEYAVGFLSDVPSLPLRSSLCVHFRRIVTRTVGCTFNPSQYGCLDAMRSLVQHHLQICLTPRIFMFHYYFGNLAKKFMTIINSRRGIVI